MASITCGHCGRTHNSVQQVRECSLFNRFLVEDRKMPPEFQTVEEQAAPPQDRVIERRTSQPAQSWSSHEPAEGMWTRDGKIYKIYRTQSSAICVKVLTEHTTFTPHQSTWTFEYLGHWRRNFPQGATRLSREEAAKFGKLYGVCCVCGRTLTDEGSIEAGIGPICSGKEW